MTGETKMNRLSILIIAPLAAFTLFAIYVLFIMIPVLMYTEAECLREGYPEYRVSIGLERYCMTLDGVITVKVDKQ